MKISRFISCALALVTAALLVSVSCHPRRANFLLDQAGGRTVADFPEVATDVFKPMDGGLPLDDDEIKGRNTWILWCGGNEQFWDRMSRESFGLIDLLKTIDSRHRPTRFAEMGLINQPGFRLASQPDEYGLWIDVAVQPEPVEIDPAVYGRATGIMGFRLFPNPAFDDTARKAWDPEKFYRDAEYAVNPKLVRPYRIGVSCGACHIAFNPLNPPADPANPGWDNLSSAIGNQYLREGRVFAHNVKEGGFFWEMLQAQPPGTSDTSRIATDHINNPNTINPLFDLGARLAASHRESVSGEALLVQAPIDQTGRASLSAQTSQIPMVLKDGADSVGVLAAILRVYVNTGTYSQHWLRQHNPLIGLTDQKPFEISTARKNSVYWNATQQKAPHIAKFLSRLKPLLLENAPGGRPYLTTNREVLIQGKRVFAAECAQCHSSKRPPSGVDPEEWFAAAVLEPDFTAGNFLADERRHAVTKIKTNAARALGSNATQGHIWASFSSDTYKSLPSVGAIEVYNPYLDRTETFPGPAGGPGYYRTPSLISLWTSAPFFHNNALGKFTGDPSVAGRMAAFDDAVEKLLWPEKRLGHDSIRRTSRECSLQVQAAVMPAPLRTLLGTQADQDGYIRLGPIPQGTPINLLANLDPRTSPAEFVKLFLAIKRSLAEIKKKNLNADESKALMREKVAPLLFAASKCPDLVEDRGHTFGADLPDGDKRALIEFLKTL